MDNTKILKSESFQYPTKAERIQAEKLIFHIPRLEFNYESALLNFFESHNINNAINKEDIYRWNHCLYNRLWYLEETYCYTIVHYNRFQKSTEPKNSDTTTNYLLFNYYTEVFYYYYFSTRDVLGQLLNLIFKLGFKENHLYFNCEFARKIPCPVNSSYKRNFFIKQ